VLPWFTASEQRNNPQSRICRSGFFVPVRYSSIGPLTPIVDQSNKHHSKNTNRKTPIAKHHSTEVLFADHDNPYYLRKNTSIISDFSELTLFS
jgi:hypothetical protein